jgi:hypothetical protein
MAPIIQRLVLTTSQAACLTALRDGKDSMTGVAIHAKLDLRRTIVESSTKERPPSGKTATVAASIRPRPCSLISHS